MALLRFAMNSFWLATLLLAACSKTPRTQITLRIDAESELASTARSMSIEVFGYPSNGSEANAELQLSQTVAVGSDSTKFPFGLAIVPKGGDTSRRFLVVAKLYASALGDPASQIGNVRLKSYFVSQQTLELRVLFENACASSRCSESQTCFAGQCIAAPEIDPRVGLPALDSGVSPDARVDAGPDVGQDVGPAMDSGVDSSMDSGVDSGTDAGVVDSGPPCRLYYVDCDCDKRPANSQSVTWSEPVCAFAPPPIAQSCTNGFNALSAASLQRGLINQECSQNGAARWTVNTTFECDDLAPLDKRNCAR